MSFADFEDIYQICSNYNEDGYPVSFGRLGIDMKPGATGSDIPLTSSERWWERAEKEILSEKNENILV